MLKQLMLKLIRQGGRGPKAPALLARPRLLLGRLGRAGRGYVTAGAGVVAAAVVFVSLLSWLAPDSDRPIASPLEAIGRAAGEVLEQVDEQVAALLGTEGESVLGSVRDGVAAASSRTPWPGVGAREDATDRSSGADPATPASETRSASGNASSASSDGSSQTSTSQSSSSQSAQEEEAPSSSGTGEPAPSAAEDEPSSPPASEPETPPASEEPPAAEEPTPPPAAEEPPPATEEPVPPPVEEPPPVVEEPPPPVVEEPPAPTEPPPLPKGPPETIVDE